MLEEDLTGRHATLAAGTILFAEKRFNSSTRRLDLYVVHARTPDDAELSLSALVFDTQKSGGLAGIINVPDIAESGGSHVVSSTLRAGSQQALELAGRGSAAEQVAGSAAASILDERERYSQESRQAQVTITVPSQTVYIRIEASF
ncbi:hypothetical protein [Alkalilimnicola ehrlichii]|uniref:hypothetical protein n=1 Tax=Alkalilimnicola ehrlichii TaxID=351052 RepID=UPI0015F25F8D|nr:hypothetical protein [Alkalilimnicola ehrlichii]